MATLRSRSSPPALPVELIEEILLRFPPDDPACLLRASVVCKTWSRAFSSPGFLRRLRTLHGAPRLLGFFHDWYDERIPPFVPTTASKFFLASPDLGSWRALDCRHGRALFVRTGGMRPLELLVWEPITGGQWRVPVPVALDTAAVLCAVDGCDHIDCHGGPFRVIFIFIGYSRDDELFFTSACVYSSETGEWSEPTSMHHEYGMSFDWFPNVLIGRSLLYFLSYGGMILEFDVGRRCLSVFNRPPIDFSNYEDSFNLMPAGNGGLGAIEALNPLVRLWSRVVSGIADADARARWVMSRVINLDYSLPNCALLDNDISMSVLGFAEGANVIFVNTDVGVFTLDLQSERVRKVCDDSGDSHVIPLVSFYTPLSRCEHPNPLQLIPNKGPRQPLKHRECEVDLESYCDHITPVVTPIAPSGHQTGYWCLACDCHVKDAESYEDRLNGKEHRTAQDMFMQGERATSNGFRKGSSLMWSTFPVRPSSSSEQDSDKTMFKQQQEKKL